MLNLEIDRTKLDEKMESLFDWEDWCRIETEVFRLQEWPELTIEELSEEMNESFQVIDGCEWRPATNNYDISPEILHLYETTRHQAFAKLEPKAEEENKKHPEWYGKWCVYCKMWSIEYKQDVCPKCRRELLFLPLNED